VCHLPLVTYITAYPSRWSSMP